MDTNKIKQAFDNAYIKYGTVLLVGLLFGWLIFSGSSNQALAEDHAGHTHEMSVDENGKQVWTCSMHPQIKMDKPGKCPICAMDLIPLKSSGAADEAVDPAAIQLSKEAVALANIQTTKVSRQNPVKEVQLYGTIQIDERLSQSQTSHVNGRIEKLFVDFTGETINKGQTIATVYSPELLTAQQELLEAAKMQSVQPSLLQAAKEKLRLWKLTDEQINAIEKTGTVNPLVEIKATVSGVVVSKNISQGDYVNQGSVIFNVANLSQVWAMFDAYETDLPFLKVGDKLEFALQALPGKTFTGRIAFIDPLLDATTRTSKVRVETANQGMLLKPGMYANASVTASLKQYNNEIVIPKSAVLWTGKRSVVYVKQPEIESFAFLLRKVELGPSLGDSYVIVSGINDGDEIVTNGAFTIDASAQLEGKRSMMNAEEGQPMTGHEGHMPGHGQPHAQPQSQSQPQSHDHGHEHTANVASAPTSEHAMMSVQGLCDMCKETIETAAKSVKGVSSAFWDKDKKEVHLNFDPSQTNLNAISKAIAKAGYDTEKDKGDQAAYDALPACCKYRK